MFGDSHCLDDKIVDWLFLPAALQRKNNTWPVLRSSHIIVILWFTNNNKQNRKQTKLQRSWLVVKLTCSFLFFFFNIPITMFKVERETFQKTQSLSPFELLSRVPQCAPHPPSCLLPYGRAVTTENLMRGLKTQISKQHKCQASCLI